jgi:hypothetical protein
MLPFGQKLKRAAGRSTPPLACVLDAFGGLLVVIGLVLRSQSIGLAAGMLFPLMAIPDIPFKEKGAAAMRLSAACMSSRVVTARSINQSDTGRRLDRMLSTATTLTRPCASLCITWPPARPAFRAELAHFSLKRLANVS